jgi:hypothetical protein
VQSGKVIDFETSKPVSGVTLDDGLGDTVTTGADGSYSLVVAKDTPFSLTLSADGYVKLLQQQTSLTSDYAAEPIDMVPLDLANTLHGVLPHYDPTLGVLSIQAMPEGQCASEEGAKVSVEGESAALVVYFQNKLPNLQLKAMKAGELPSAVIYNLPPGVAVNVQIEHPTCHQAPFPVVTNGGVTYLAGVTTQPGNVTAFQRIFLQ